MKLGRYDVPTPLLVGGIAGVGILVLGQRLTGDAAPTEQAVAPEGAAPGGGTPAGVGDLWGESEVGQFPSFVSAPPTNPSYGWWDDEAPPPTAPINVPTPPPANPTTPVVPPSATTWHPAQLGAPPAGTSGYISVSGAVFWYTIPTGSTTATGRVQGSPKFAAFVSGPRTIRYLGKPYSAYYVLSGSHRGKWIGANSNVRFVRKP